MADEKKAGAPSPGASQPVVVEGRPLAPAVAGPKTKGFTLKRGKNHFHEGRKVEEGETVQLTETQFNAFRDKFESDEDIKKRKDIEKAKAKGQLLPPAATSTFPQDKGAAKPNPEADLRPGNPVPIGTTPPAPPPAPEK